METDLDALDVTAALVRTLVLVGLTAGSVFLGVYWAMQLRDKQRSGS
jgi:hypothetical protein